MKKEISKPTTALKWLAAVALVCSSWQWSASSVGFWTPVATPAPDGVRLMLLLSDGTVMAQQGGDINWYKLTPDNHGHYVNGTWTTNAPMHDTRLYYSSAVMRDGRVLVAGGEYGSGRAKAEVYDPVFNTWTVSAVPLALMDPSAGEGFSDSPCKMLPNGNVLVAPVSPHTSGGTLIYNPNANTWAAGPTLFRGGDQDEASWVKLPDDSILTIDPFGTRAERYIPSLNRWIDDAIVPVQMYSTVGGELGAAFLLPNGNAFFLGATTNTVIYTPTGTTNHGSWVVGSAIPGGLTCPDAAAAMMVNGRILCAVSPAMYRTNIMGTNYNIFPAPTTFYEYDYLANSFSAVATPSGSTEDYPTYVTCMLDLPDGTVLYSFGSSQLYVYQPSGSPLAAGKPAINGVSWNGDGSLHLTGTLLNGISEGAAYGDDLQVDSNYPLVRLADGGGNVTHARTYNWSSSSVMTGARVASTEFALPHGMFPGFYSLTAVANGISSDPLSFYGPVWVDFYSSAFFEFGSYDFPFKTLTGGISAVAAGGTIMIKGPASHRETPRITKAVTIRSAGGVATIGR